MTDAVDFFGVKMAWKFGSRDDARHEAMVYIADHPTVLGDEDTIGSGLIYLRLAQRVKKNAIEPVPETSEVINEHVEPPVSETPISMVDGPYELEKVARIVSVCYDLSLIDKMSDPFADVLRPEVDRRSAKDPSHANSQWAEATDLRKVYRRDRERRVNKAELTPKEEVALLCKYALDMTDSMLQIHGVSTNNADRGLRKIVNYMNGYGRTS